VAFVRTVKTPRGDGGADRVVLVGGSRSIEHIGSAHDVVELAALMTAAAARLAAGRTEVDLGLSEGVEPGTLPITSSRMTHLWNALCVTYRVLGFESITKGDDVFRGLVLARINAPSPPAARDELIGNVESLVRSHHLPFIGCFRLAPVKSRDVVYEASCDSSTGVQAVSAAGVASCSVGVSGVFWDLLRTSRPR
jgi:hypothetical protein